MKKTKLTLELIENAIDFYSKNFDSIFTPSELENLQKKLLNTIEYDIVHWYPSYDKDLPLNTLSLIYFIGEYKRAYRDSKKDYKDNRTDTLESLGKGFPNKKEASKKFFDEMNDKNLDINDRVMALYKRMLLLGVKNKRYSKIGVSILGYIYMNFPMHYRELKRFYCSKPSSLMLLDKMSETLKYFEYTYLAQDKISNSLLIILYNKLTLYGVDEKQAFKFSKDIVSTYLDEDKIPTDKYRISYLQEKDIYFAGLYSGLPIYQWYTGKQESYYSDRDIKQFQKFVRLMRKEINSSFQSSHITTSMFKKLQPNTPITLDDIFNILENDNNMTRSIILDTHQYFIKKPFKLLFTMIPLKITLKDKIKSFFLVLLTKFTG